MSDHPSRLENIGLESLVDEAAIKSEDRLAAVLQNVDLHIRSWQHHNTQDPVKKLLLLAADEFNNFLKQRMKDIRDFPVAGQNQNSEIYFRNNLRAAYLQEAQRDWHDIERAAHQRSFYRNRDNDAFFKPLVVADQIAAAYLKMVSAVLSPGINTTPICYFDKHSSVNRAPYTTLPIIGIPITATTVPTDYYAIAHEIGHYVYRCLDPARKQIIEQKAEALDSTTEYPSDNHQFSNWTEEIFADVVSHLLAGDEYASQFMALLLQSRSLQAGTDGKNSEHPFEHDDGEHPPAILRPMAFGEIAEKSWVRTLGELDIAVPIDLRDRFTELVGTIRSTISEIGAQPRPPLVQGMSPAIFDAISVSDVYVRDKYTYVPGPAVTPISTVEEFRTELIAWDKRYDIIPWFGAQ